MPTDGDPVQKTEAIAFKMFMDSVRHKKWNPGRQKGQRSASPRNVPGWLCFAFGPVLTLPSSKGCWGQWCLPEFLCFPRVMKEVNP